MIDNWLLPLSLSYFIFFKSIPSGWDKHPAEEAEDEKWFGQIQVSFFLAIVLTDLSFESNFKIWNYMLGEGLWTKEEGIEQQILKK